ncbi:MAG: AAA family ATPase, partial [Planctomycetota bacterium]
MDIIRDTEIQQIHQKFSDYPIVAILGTRQCGKTTLSRQFIERYPFSETHFFDLEDPRDNYALDNSMAVLGACQGLVVLDEIQRKPDLFPALRVLADQNKGTKYLILGSSSLELVKTSSESLAGRISFLELGGLSLRDIPPTDFDKLWIRGSFPKSLLARSESTSVQWREDFIHTFLEKDIHNLGINIPAVTMHRFWSMIANYHGQIYNSSEIGRSLGVSEHTSKRYLDILTNTFIV